MEHIYRLDDTDAYDAVCDGPDDKGVDGVYIDDNLERIDVLQSRLVKSSKGRTLGDTLLKEFVGTLAQFHNPDIVQEIAETTSNTELKKLLLTNEVPTKIRNGYNVRGIFIINVNRDKNSERYLSSRSDVILFDRDQITTSYIPTGPSVPMAKPVEFDIYGYDYAEYSVSGIRTIVAPLSALQLIKLDGLASGALFAWNVRQTLGKTKVNKEISASIQNPAEHGNFLLYHNGLTILCSSIAKHDDKITISGYSVVNGCQSLTTLYDNRAMVSDDLRILSRLIELPPDSDLAAKITHHSNNQNPINARDLQSNSALQRRLQNEFDKDFLGEVFYRIKRGEQSTSSEIIDNEEAAREILAFDLQEPWTCHQTYKHFDELHAEIFARPDVTAKRIYVLNLLYNLVTDTLPKIDNKEMAGYRLTRYFLLYLLRRALDHNDIGKQFSRKPEEFLVSKDGKNRIIDCAARVLDDIIIDLNAELRDREEQQNPIDYKRELKSPRPIKILERAIIPQYQKAVSRGRATSFGQEWKQTE
ncbi:MAG: AIPR family protein [Candidatus Thorarchaeota archaeon]|nr:AIPR family protein [Candidatus Thorarchaeota archaeon]